MRTTAKRAIAAFATGAVLVLTATTAATAAPAAALAPAPAPARAAGWEWIGEFSKAGCISLRDSYAGSAKCVRNAGGLYDLYVWVS
ncbi:hypothetical protein [Streptomyces griseus]|uniref:hypothetical protein n=1 Tax=Streptomyces griseus TaxID=1911 RepID=UPI0004C55702|nr:hypothetical protein [Streptomyces griseus]